MTPTFPDQILMSTSRQPYFWKRMPFVRLIIPLIAGILLQWNCHLNTGLFLSLFFGCLVILFLSAYIPLTKKFAWRWLAGVAINGSLVVAGAGLLYRQDISHLPNYINRYNTDSAAILVTLQEPLVEKEKTFKALASADAVQQHGEWVPTVGNILIYFSKDSIPPLQYGSQVLIYKPLQPIKNSGNPGGFDYKQYCAFQDVFDQVFLRPQEYIVTGTIQASAFKNWLFQVRTSVINTLQRYVHGDQEAGVAEALLIGYRDDLDKDLVQAYSNTGVVHIIAISGLHLGMIYMVLVWLMKPFKKIKFFRFVKPLVILTVLWVFTMLAGAVPSILRAAVMFSFIVLGEAINRKGSIFNTLAASAFVMLCINPYYLWDVGFQLIVCGCRQHSFVCDNCS